MFPRMQLSLCFCLHWFYSPLQRLEPNFIINPPTNPEEESRTITQPPPEMGKKMQIKPIRAQSFRCVTVNIAFNNRNDSKVSFQDLSRTPTGLFRDTFWNFLRHFQEPSVPFQDPFRTLPGLFQEISRTFPGNF